MSELLNKVLNAKKDHYVARIIVATAEFGERLPALPVDNRPTNIRELELELFNTGATKADYLLAELQTGQKLNRDPHTGRGDALAGYLVAWVPMKRFGVVCPDDAKFMGEFEYGKTYLNVTSTGKVRDGSKDFMVNLRAKPRFQNVDVRPATDAEITALVDAFLTNRPASFVKMFDNDGGESNANAE